MFDLSLEIELETSIFVLPQNMGELEFSLKDGARPVEKKKVKETTNKNQMSP
jgi:hypothetical protein